MFESRWWVAFAAGWINLFIFAVFRSAGVFYLSFIETFSCSYQQAAWPISLAGSISSTFGIFVGFATHFVSLRILIMIGIVISATSVSVTYFAVSIQFVQLTIGVFQGIGIGFVTNLLPAVLNQHFPDKKAVALGISYGGATLGAFIFPVVIHRLLKLRGFHQTMLLIGILSISGLLGTFFMRSKKPKTNQNESHVIQMKDFATASQALSSHPATPTTCTSLSSSPEIEEPHPLIRECETIVYVNENKLYANITENSSHGSPSDSSSDTCDDDDDHDEKYSTGNKRNTDICSKIYLNIVQDWKLISNFSFALCTFSYMNFIIDFVSFIIILPDIAKDRGIDDSHAKWLLSIFSITDFAGRILPGWLSHLNIITDKNIYILSMTFLGLCMALIIAVREWAHFVALTLVCGFATGCQMVLTPTILADYFGVENTAVSFGLANFFCGALSLIIRPLIIGSKDIYGSYYLLSYILSFSTIGAGLIWLIESIVTFKIQ